MNTHEKVWKTGMFVGILLVIFLAVMSVKELKSIGFVGKDVPAVNTITINGTGDALSVPDVATFSFTVSETAKTVADAQAAATAKINDALKAVRDAGVSDKDISTLSYNINPHYEYQNAVCTTENASAPVPPMVSGAGVATVSVPVTAIRYCPPGKSVLTGYEVSQTIQVKVRDLSKAGSIFTSIGSLGVQNVDSLAFSVDQPETVKAEARAKAISDAKDKAATLAKQLGVSLGRITGFYESSGPMPIYGLGGGIKAAAMETSAAPVPEVPTGEQKVTSNVTITYEID
ncbi:SIMPL domain-containing protein [Patescibacteria group bacterium]|nr:SIMPL domain-containing protein [Patescibacteria group bacterium]MDE1946428.1 SIMPL domain-containing protein [Patescibacteria group bacterium]MDE2011037.1 SIMPL domain-containing protein [Patescibacteria group bacterium]MDE2233627.1 SIMPL domain-containing protein [Patescibacteria group bacterium]